MITKYILFFMIYSERYRLLPCVSEYKIIEFLEKEILIFFINSKSSSSELSWDFPSFPFLIWTMIQYQYATHIWGYLWITLNDFHNSDWRWWSNDQCIGNDYMKWIDLLKKHNWSRWYKGKGRVLFNHNVTCSLISQGW